MKKFQKLLYKYGSNEFRIKSLKKSGLKIGNNCEIYPSADFGSEPYLIEIGDNVRITDDVKITTHDGGTWVLRNNGLSKNADLFGKVKIGNNVHIGPRVIIMPGVIIGDNCIIGAGAIVTKNIKENSVAVGIPAHVIETIDEYYSKNKDKIKNTKQLDLKEKKEYLLSHIKSI